MTEARPKPTARITDWLYLDDGLVPLISRLVGVTSLPIALVVWFWSHAGQANSIYPQPFNVPTWRFGTYLLQVPLPPEWVNCIVFGIFVIGCVALIAGKWSRWLYLYMATVLAYYTARDFFVCCLHWVLLDFLFLCALAFRAKPPGGRSPTRRLIQLTIFTCYIFGVLQKIFYPDFLNGISLEAYYYDGWAVVAPFRQFCVEHQIPMSMWPYLTYLLLACETFLGFALFFKQTRLAACILGLILHGGILVTMEWIIWIFSIEMWTGYLAFFDGKKKSVVAPPGSGAAGSGAVESGAAGSGAAGSGGAESGAAESESVSAVAETAPAPAEPAAARVESAAATAESAAATAESAAATAESAAAPAKSATAKAGESPALAASPVKTGLSLAFIALLVLMPARIYYLPGPPPEMLTLFERTPWGFGMFLLRQKVAKLDIAVEDAGGKTETLPVIGRMESATNDNELISIARYALRLHPEAKSIRINDLIVVNEKRYVLRTLLWDNPAGQGSEPKISVTLAGDYCRGAANRNPEAAPHL